MQDTKIIEEMANTIGRNRMACSEYDCRECENNRKCLYQDIACILYREEYRQQIKGKWIRHKENCLYNKCSICSYEHCREDNYCPHCGARMKGGAK